MATDDWVVEQVSTNVHTIRFDNIKAGWEQFVLLSSDRHHDNLHADQRLERAHLEKARERNAPIIDAGDLYDAMGGKWDPRKDYDQMRPEYTGNNYLDRLVEVAANFYSPYAGLFAVLGHGNHETAMLKHHETDLTSRLARRLRFLHPGAAWPFTGGYSGWVFFRFTRNKSKYQTLRLKYHHGSAGGEVTKGVPKSSRRAVYLPDADIIMSGHSHDAYLLPLSRERVTQRGQIYLDTQWHIQIPGYKQEYTGDGYHAEKERPPKSRGCAWLRFYHDDDRVQVQPLLDIC